MKIQDIAEKQELSTKEVITILSGLGIKNKRSTSNLNREELEKFNTYLVEQEDRRPEVALIKKKDRDEQEEHKKIVIKKKKVIILKKHPKPEEKKGEPVAAKVVEEKPRKVGAKGAPLRKKETAAEASHFK